jgi:DNA polymerase-1
VIADYRAMVLRVAAQIVGEVNLLQAFRDGQDAHRLTAARLLDKAVEAVTKEERQMAKAVNFGLLYGQGVKGLQAYAASTYGVELSEEKARKLREAWFEAYPAFRAWHRRLGSEAKRALAVRTPAGRERRWPSVKEFKETEAYNTPVQGGAAEAMLAALAALQRDLEGLDAEPVAVIHDEVIVEADAAQAEKVAEVLAAAMQQGMAAIFPDAPVAGLVEAHVGRSWADK